jgi:AcrR family transcriptional regulator
MPGRKVTPEVLEEMGRLRRGGMSYGEIAGRLGLSPMTVYYHLQKKRKRTRMTSELLKEMADMRKRGHFILHLMSPPCPDLQTVKGKGSLNQ